MTLPVLANAQWERFAQGVAKGLTAVDAYVEAGYKRNDGASARLKGRPEVSARIAEILARGAKKVELSRADILQMLLDDRELARSLGQSSAATKAAELLGKELYGMFVDRKEVGKPGEFAGIDNSTSAEKLIAERLGLAKQSNRALEVPSRQGSVRGKPNSLH